MDGCDVAWGGHTGNCGEQRGNLGAIRRYDLDREEFPIWTAPDVYYGLSPSPMTASGMR